MELMSNNVLCLCGHDHRDWFADKNIKMIHAVCYYSQLDEGGLNYYCPCNMYRQNNLSYLENIYNDKVQKR
jgi:hypothetical protein